jgi:hypothetical protein
MSVPKRSRRFARLGIGMLVLLGLGVVSLQPASAQTRTVASLAAVPAYIPAPYHPHAISAYYGSSLYEGYPYYGGVYLGGGAHYWH